MRTLSKGTFEWLEIYEPTTYFPFSTKISLCKFKYCPKYFNVNINVNVENIKMKRPQSTL